MKIYDYNGKKNISGIRIHEARRNMKLTQSELAAKLQLAEIIIENEMTVSSKIARKSIAE